MSDNKPIESASADELAKTKKPGDIQLNEEDLKEVVGGGVDLKMKIDPIVSDDVLKIKPW